MDFKSLDKFSKPPSYLLFIQPSREGLSKIITRDDNFIEEYTFHEWNGSSRTLSSHVRRNRYRRAGSIPRPATTAGNRFRVWSSSFVFSVLLSATIHIDSFWSITRDQAGRCARSWLPRCAFRRASPRFPSDRYPFFGGYPTIHVRSKAFSRPTSIGKITIRSRFSQYKSTWMQKSEKIYFKLKHAIDVFPIKIDYMPFKLSMRIALIRIRIRTLAQ